MAIVKEQNGHQQTVLCIIKDGQVFKEVREGDRLVFKNSPIFDKKSSISTSIYLIPGYYEVYVVGGGGGSVVSGVGGGSHADIYIDPIEGE